MAVAKPVEKAEELLTAKEESFTALIWRRFKKHKVALLGLFVIFMIFAFSFVGPLFRPGPNASCISTQQNQRDCIYDPIKGFAAGSSPEHPMGLTYEGRDMMIQLMYAGRVSLFIGFFSTILTTIIGVIVGAVSGYFGGWVDTIIMRIVEFILTLPLLPILLILAAIRAQGGAGFIDFLLPELVVRPFAWMLSMSRLEEARNLLALLIILIIFSWTGTALLVRGTILSLRTQEYTDAARALGSSSWRIIRKHMIPNSMAPIIVSATLAVGGFIILESALSFLGFGVQIPTPTWGRILNSTRGVMFDYPGLTLYPGVLIFLTVLAINYIGDALRDALDPRLKD